MNNLYAHPASFKDPAGFIFLKDGVYYRQVNNSAAADYDLLMNSGLYEKLVKQKKLIPHAEVSAPVSDTSVHYKTILPEQLSFTSYAYEWCFEQLKDAALTTLQIQKTALEHGMILKDATPFNIQFKDGRPVFIDTLSFQKYTEGDSWVAYKQFCESFLAPLLLMCYRDLSLNSLLLTHLNGIPLTIAAKLLPAKTKFNLGIYLHIHLQAKFQLKAFAGNTTGKKKLGLQQLKNITSSLINLTQKLQLPKQKTAWNNYYDETILSKEYFNAKQKLVTDFLLNTEYKIVLDLGANTGEFSFLAAEKAEKVIAADFDTACINRLYTLTKEQQFKNIFPVVINAANPTPATGWANRERESFLERANADVILALALIHHLCITANITLAMIASLLKTKCKYLVIEFIPKSDPKVQQLLCYRQDVFTDYTMEKFEENFSAYFIIQKKQLITGTGRILYLMKTQ